MKTSHCYLFLLLFFTPFVWSQHVSFELKNFPKQKKQFEAAHEAFTQGSIAFEAGYKKWEQKQKQFSIKRKYYPLSIRDFERTGAEEFNFALKELEQAAAFNPQHQTLQFMLGFCKFIQSPKSIKAWEHFKKCQTMGTLTTFDALYWMAWSAQMQERWLEAENLYKQFLSASEAAHKTSNLLKEAVKKRLDECRVGLDLSQSPIAVSIENLGPQINSPYPEYSPCITADQSHLFYTSRRPGGLNRTKDRSDNQYLEDIYGAEWIRPKWQASALLKGFINSEAHDAVCGVNSSGNRLFLFRSDASNGGDIFESDFNGREWSLPLHFNAPINSPHYENSASLNPYEKRMYFTSDRQGGQSDIFSAEWQTRAWGGLKNLGEPVNSPFDEGSVFLHPDGKTLYFSSQRYGSMGGYDIFLSRYENGSWSKPVNLGYPINGPDDDVFFVLSGDGNSAYYAAHRSEGLGDLDIYKIVFLKTQDTLLYKSPELYLVKGRVVDAGSQAPVEAFITVLDADKNELLYSAYTNSVDGMYLVPLPAGKNYAFHVNKSGYVFKSENFNIPEHPSFKEIELNVALEPIRTRSEIILNNLFFDFNSAVLTAASNSELNKLMELLSSHPEISIEIISYTDNAGTTSFNLDLSAARSKSVAAYLVAKGIDPKRLKTSGKGEAEPVSDNASPEGRAKNRRTAFKIIP